jgi:hypothetical protein
MTNFMDLQKQKTAYYKSRSSDPVPRQKRTCNLTYTPGTVLRYISRITRGKKTKNTQPGTNDNFLGNHLLYSICLYCNCLFFC